MAGDKRKRVSSPIAASSSPEPGPSTVTKKSRVQPNSPKGPEPKVEIVWELVGSDQSYSRHVGDSNLDEVVPIVAGKLGASLLGLTLMHVRNGGYEAPVWDDYDYQAIKARALATSSRQEVVRVYSGAIGRVPTPPPHLAVTRGDKGKSRETPAANNDPTPANGTSNLSPIVPPTPLRIPSAAPTPRSALKAPGAASTPRPGRRVILAIPDSPPDTPIASPELSVPSPSASQSPHDADQTKKGKRRSRHRRKSSDGQELEAIIAGASTESTATASASAPIIPSSASAAATAPTASPTPATPIASPAPAASTPTPRPAVVPSKVAQYKPVRPSPLSQSAAAADERPKKRSRASDVPPVVGTLPPVVRTIEPAADPAVEPAPQPIPIPGSEPPSKEAAKAKGKGKAAAKEAQSQSPVQPKNTPAKAARRTSRQSLTTESEAAASPAAATEAPSADAPPAEASSTSATTSSANHDTEQPKDKSKGKGKGRPSAIVHDTNPRTTANAMKAKRQSVAAEMAALIAADYAAQKAAGEKITTEIAAEDHSEQTPKSAESPNPPASISAPSPWSEQPATPTPRSKTAPKETIMNRMIREIREKKASEEAAAAAAAVSEENAPLATTPVTAKERRKSATVVGTPTTTPTANGTAATAKTTPKVTPKANGTAGIKANGVPVLENNEVGPSSSGAASSESDDDDEDETGSQGSWIPAEEGKVTKMPCPTCGKIVVHLQKDCPVVLAGVKSLQARLEARRAELVGLAAKNAPKNTRRKSNPAYEEKNDYVCDAIKLWLGKLQPSPVANGTTASPKATPKAPAKAAAPSPSVPSSHKVTILSESEVSEVSEHESESESDDSAKGSSSRSSAPTETPVPAGPAKTLPNRASSVDTPFIPMALHQKALIRPRRPGSMSGLSVSDAVIETADSSDSDSDSDSDSESLSTASSSNSDSDSDSSSDEGLEPADLMRRIMVENPLSKRDMKKARISAASMHHVEAEEASDIDESDDEPLPRPNHKRRDSGSSIGDFEDEGAPPVSVLLVGNESDAEEDAERAKLLNAVTHATATQEVIPDVAVEDQSEEEQEVIPAVAVEDQSEEEQEVIPAVAVEDQSEEEQDELESAADEVKDDESEDKNSTDTSGNEDQDLEDDKNEDMEMEEGEGATPVPSEVDDHESITQGPVEDDLEPISRDSPIDLTRDTPTDNLESITPPQHVEHVTPDEAMDVDEPTQNDGHMLAVPRAMTTPVASPVKLMPRSSGSRGFQGLLPSSPALGDFEGDIALREAIEEDDGLPGTQVPMSDDDDLPATQADVVESQSQLKPADASEGEREIEVEEPPSPVIVPKRRGRPPKNAPKAPTASQTKAKSKIVVDSEEAESLGLRRSGRTAVGRGLPSSQPIRVTRSASGSASSSQPAPSTQPEPRLTRRAARASSREPPASQPLPTRRTRASSREPSVALVSSPEKTTLPLPIAEDDEEITPRATNAPLPSSPQTARGKQSSQTELPDSSFPASQSSRAKTQRSPLTRKSSLPSSSFPPPPLFRNSSSHQLSDIEPMQATQSSPLTHRRTTAPESPLFMAGQSQMPMETQAYNPNPPPLIPETQLPQTPATGRSTRSLRGARSAGSISSVATPTAAPAATEKRRPGRPRKSSNVTNVTNVTAVTATEADDGATSLRDDASDDDTATTASRALFPNLPYRPRSSQVAPTPSSFPTLGTLSKDVLREGTKFGTSVLSAIASSLPGRASLGGAGSSQQVLPDAHSDSDDDDSDSSASGDEHLVSSAQAGRYTGNKRRQSAAIKGRASLVAANNGW